LTGGLYLDTADSLSMLVAYWFLKKVYTLKLYVMISLIGCMVAVFDTDE